MQSFEPDYYESDLPCPECGNPVTRWRDCGNFSCEDGFIFHCEEDPLLYDEDDCEVCPECHGTGIEAWCPQCGADLSLPKYHKVTEEMRQ